MTREEPREKWSREDEKIILKHFSRNIVNEIVPGNILLLLTYA